MRPEATYRTSARLTKHCRARMRMRAIGQRAIDLAIEFGRIVFTRGAVIYAIGRKEIALARTRGVDLTALDGVQVVCAGGVVLTTYRNRDFRGLSYRQRRRRRRSRWPA